MRKLALILALFFAGKLAAQSTTVSGTITDTPDGQAWFNGTYSFVFRVAPSNPTAQYFWNGVPFSSTQTIAGSLDGTGSYSQIVPSNTSITPSGSTWDVTFCPLATAQCVTYQSVTVTGTTQTFAPSPASIRINLAVPLQNPRAYTDTEVVNGALGQTYFNLVSTVVRVCSVFPCGWTNSSGGTSITLQTNGGTNPVQSLLNIKNGAGVTVTSDGSGGVTITSLSCGTTGTGIIQASNGAGGCQATDISEVNGLVGVNVNTSQRGPNLGVDVTRFGVQAINHNVIPSPTATISATTNSATVSSATGLATGNGFVIVGAGAAQTMTTPTAPTVTPSCASGPTGMGYTVPVPGGGTSYAYSLIMLDANYGYTAASTNGTTSTGNATLGARSTANTSIAVTTGTNIFTATVGSTAELAAGCMVLIEGTTDDAEFGGYKIILAVTDGTHFTYLSGINQLYGMTATTATGGTVHYWLCNHIVMPTPGAGGVQYGIYGRTSGAMTFLDMSLIANLGYTDAAYNTWDDYGSPMMDSPPTMWWMPSSPPGSPVNDMLITFITNISGTTLTLNDNAGTSVTTASARFDNTAPFLAAQTASNTTATGGGGTLRFPPVLNNSGTGVDCYVFSSPFIVTARAVIQDGELCLGGTMKMTGGTIWQGTVMDSIRLLAPVNGMAPHIPIIIQGANPGLWLTNAHVSGVNFINGNNGGIDVFNSASNNSQNFSDLGFSSGGSGDYMTVGFYDYHQSIGGAFGWQMDRITCSTGPNQVIGSTTTPCFASKFNTLMNVRGYSGNRRGIYIVPHSSGLSGSFQMGQEIQGLITPMFAFQGGYAGNTSGSFRIMNPFQDTSAGCVICNLSASGMSLGAMISIDGTNLPGSNSPIISGQPFGGTINVSNSSMTRSLQLGQNFGVNVFGGNNAWNPGARLTSLTQNTASYSSSHTLNANEGAVIATATLTFTVDCTLGDGTAWDIYSQAGVTTIAASAGCTLYGANSTGPYQLQNGSGVHITLKGATANSSGGPGGGTGCPPGGSTDALQYNGGGGCSFGGVNSPTNPGNYSVNYNTVGGPVAPTINLPGIPVNPQTGTTYTYLFSDRGSLVKANNAGAQTYALTNPSATGFGFNYFNVLWGLGAGAITENASGFTINGSSSLVTPSGWARFLYSDGVNYFGLRFPDFNAFPASCTTAITVVAGVFGCGSAGSVSSVSGDTGLFCNVSSTGAVTLVPCATTLAHKFWGNNTGATGTAAFVSIGEGDLPATTVFTDKANTYGAFLQDFSAGTWKVPSCTVASSTNMVCYDGTNKDMHIYSNNADAIALGIPSAPATGDIFDSVVSSGSVLAHDSGIATANVVTAASAAAAAKQTCVSGGANKTCNYIDFPEVLIIPAANCNNATGGNGWSIGSGGTVNCRPGTNNKGGYVAITDTSTTFAQFQIAIPEDWDSGTNPYIRVQFGYPGTDTGHTIIPSIQTSCAKGDGSTTDDVTLNAAHSLSTTTTNATANQFWSSSNVQMNSTDVTGCVAGGIMVIQVGRATDTATSAVNFYSATVTIPRLLMVQAN